MKILVTGGAGFIGSWVTDELISRGHTLAVIDDLTGGYRRNVNPEATFFEVTLTDTDAVDHVFANFRPEAVLHCAAYAAEGLSHWMRRYCVEQNSISWANLANAIVKAGVRRAVVCSSMAVYGSQQPPFTEDMRPSPEDPYGAAKAAMEIDLRALSAVQGTEWIIVRPHNVYGPRQNLADPYRNVVAIFMRQALTHQPITVFGDGQQVRAFSYIEDVAGAIASVVTGFQSSYIVNVGGEEPIAIEDLAKRVIAATGAMSELIHLAPRHEVRDAYCDHTVLRSILGGWEPTTMDVGIPRMAEWAKNLTIGPLRKYDYEVTTRLYEAWR